MLGRVALGMFLPSPDSEEGKVAETSGERREQSWLTADEVRIMFEPHYGKIYEKLNLSVNYLSLNPHNYPTF